MHVNIRCLESHESDDILIKKRREKRMNKKPINFGKNLKLLRNKHNKSQKSIADHVGVCRQTVSKWEKGISIPDIEILLTISNLFNVSLDSLIYGPILSTNKKAIIDYILEQEYKTSIIEQINKKGYYDILIEDIQEITPIGIDFEDVMAIAVYLQKKKFTIASLFANGFGIYFQSDEEAREFKKGIDWAMERIIHNDDELLSELREKYKEIVSDAKHKVIMNAESILFKNRNFYWIDSEEKMRGYGIDEADCIAQAKSQNCADYQVFQD